jgi:hypothetical protein
VLVSASAGTVTAAVAARPGWTAEPAGFEPVVLAYLRRPQFAAAPPAARGTAVA